MSEIFIKINPYIMKKMFEIQDLQLEKKTDLFYYGMIDLNHVLSKSLELMLKMMKKEIEKK